MFVSRAGFELKLKAKYQSHLDLISFGPSRAERWMIHRLSAWDLNLSKARLSALIEISLHISLELAGFVLLAPSICPLHWRSLAAKTRQSESESSNRAGDRQLNQMAQQHPMPLCLGPRFCHDPTQNTARQFHLASLTLNLRPNSIRALARSN